MPSQNRGRQQIILSQIFQPSQNPVCGLFSLCTMVLSFEVIRFQPRTIAINTLVLHGDAQGLYGTKIVTSSQMAF